MFVGSLTTVSVMALGVLLRLSVLAKADYPRDVVYPARGRVVPAHIPANVDSLSVAAIPYIEDTIQKSNAAGTRVKVLLVCNPHNPLGRAYPEDTLRAYAELAEKVRRSDPLCSVSWSLKVVINTLVRCTFTSRRGLRESGLCEFLCARPAAIRIHIIAERARLLSKPRACSRRAYQGPGRVGPQARSLHLAAGGYIEISTLRVICFPRQLGDGCCARASPNRRALDRGLPGGEPQAPARGF